MSNATEKKIIKVIRKTVLESVQGLFDDPDRGLALRGSTKRRLSAHRAGRKEKLVSLKAIKAKHL